MNRIAILALACFIFLSACQEAHDNNSVTKAISSGTLEGTWRLRTLTVGHSSRVDSNTIIQVLIGLLLSNNTATCTVRGDSVYADSTAGMKFSTKDGILTLYSRDSSKGSVVANYGIFGDSLVLSDLADGSTMLSFKRR